MAGSVLLVAVDMWAADNVTLDLVGDICEWGSVQERIMAGEDKENEGARRQEARPKYERLTLAIVRDGLAEIFWLNRFVLL